MRKLFLTILVVLLIAVLYLFLKPNDCSPEYWVAPKPATLNGPLTPNKELQNIFIASTQKHEGPEDVALDSLGRIYTGTNDGCILRYTPDGKSFEIFAQTQGRPLGLDFDQRGNLIVADVEKGLLSIDPGGAITSLSTKCNDLKYKFTDDVEVASDGKIYFTDASWKYSVWEYKSDLIEHGANGRLMCYDPATARITLLMDSMYFANGVAISPEEDYLLINETSNYRVIRYWLKGPKKGQNDIFTENLPGFPDGITLGTGGVYWLTIASPRDKLLDMLLPHPRIRKMLANLPPALQPKPKKYGLVLGLNTDGDIVRSLHDPDGGFTPITSAEEYNGRLYLGNLTEAHFAYYQL